MGAVFVPDERQEALKVRAAVGLSDAYTCAGLAWRRARAAWGGSWRAKPWPSPISKPTRHARPARAAPSPRVPLDPGRAADPSGPGAGRALRLQREPRHWSPLEAELLLVFASQAANAMQNALLFERLRAEKATLDHDDPKHERRADRHRRAGRDHPGQPGRRPPVQRALHAQRRADTCEAALAASPYPRATALR